MIRLLLLASLVAGCSSHSLGGASSEGAPAANDSGEGATPTVPPTGETMPPAAPTPGVGCASMLSAAGSTSCALRRDDTVWCWGSPLWAAKPFAIFAPEHVSDFNGTVALSVGSDWTCAFGTDGKVACLGGGVLRHGNDYTIIGSQSLTSIPTTADALAAESEPGAHCAVDQTGVLNCWFAPIYNSASNSNPSLTVQTVASNIRQAAAGYRQGCVVDTSANVRCFTFDYGTGSMSTLGSPMLSNAESIAVGEAHACALTENGSVWCWGSNYFGQLGNGATADSAVPVQTLPPGSAIGVASGVYSTCAWSSDGRIQCWGYHPLNPSQRGGPTLPSVLIAADGQPFAEAMQVAVGFHHACALTKTNAIYCWGDDDVGQAGVVGGTPIQVPTQVVVPCGS